MGQEVDEGDLNNHIKEHQEEHSNEELKELLLMQYTNILQEISSEEEVEAEEVISTSEVKEILAMWEKLSRFIKGNSPKRF